MHGGGKITWMCSFRVKHFQEADYVYYVICVYRCPMMHSDIEQDSIINDFALGMSDVYILLMRHHYDHVTLYLSVYICSHPVFAPTKQIYSKSLFKQDK